MRKATSEKNQNSMALFKFCQRVLNLQRDDGRVNDQEIGRILGFNPSDCSHWKRGKKAIKSIFAIDKISNYLDVDLTLVSDVANGSLSLDEALFEYNEFTNLNELSREQVLDRLAFEPRAKVLGRMVDELIGKAGLTAPPLYLPEILSLFPYISFQTMELSERFSRILKGKNQTYIIKYKKGELRSQTRLSIAKNLGKILLDFKRDEFDYLPAYSDQFILSEINYFASNLLVPRQFLLQEISKVDLRKNLVAELAGMFWVPKSLISLRLKEVLTE